VLQGRVLSQHRGQTELAVQLLLPLLDQPDRDQDQRPGRQAAQAQLAGDQPGLDGLAQPDLVGQDRPATHRPQRGPGRLELVAERLEPQPRQRHQRLEPGRAHTPTACSTSIEVASSTVRPCSRQRSNAW